MCVIRFLSINTSITVNIRTPFILNLKLFHRLNEAFKGHGKQLKHEKKQLIKKMFPNIDITLPQIQEVNSLPTFMLTL